MEDTYEDLNIGVTWRRSGQFVVCDDMGLAPSEAWLPNGWHVRWLYGETYELLKTVWID